jgi:hypothetical protein
MRTNVLRRVSVLGGCAWLGVAGYGITTMMTESGDSWGAVYALFTVALLLGAVSTVLIVAGASRQGNRPRLRMAGLVVSGLGCAVAVLAGPASARHFAWTVRAPRPTENGFLVAGQGRPRGRDLQLSPTPRTAPWCSDRLQPSVGYRDARSETGWSSADPRPEPSFRSETVRRDQVSPSSGSPVMNASASSCFVRVVHRPPDQPLSWTSSR